MVITTWAVKIAVAMTMTTNTDMITGTIMDTAMDTITGTITDTIIATAQI